MDTMVFTPQWRLSSFKKSSKKEIPDIEDKMVKTPKLGLIGTMLWWIFTVIMFPYTCTKCILKLSHSTFTTTLKSVYFIICLPFQGTTYILTWSLHTIQRIPVLGRLLPTSKPAKLYSRPKPDTGAETF